MTLQALPPFPSESPLPSGSPFPSPGAGEEGPGWTGEVLDVVEPYLLRRPAAAGDVTRFRDLPWTAAAQLLQRLPRAQLADKQNGAPSLGAVLTAAVGHPREVEVHGYLVPPSRADERITAEGIVVYDHPELDEFLLVRSEEPCEETGCECQDFWRSVQTSLGLADADHGPDLVVPRTCRRTGREGWYLWWG